MKISFTGIRNASYIYDSDKQKGIKASYLNTQLKDDEYGNDLTEYKKLISKHSAFQNPYYSNFINIASINHKGTNVTVLNGIIIPEHNNFLQLFEFIAKLTKKISEMPEKDIIHDAGYLKNDYSDLGLLLNRRVSTSLQPYDKDWKEKIHNPASIKKCAGKIFKGIEAEMLEYFA